MKGVSAIIAIILIIMIVVALAALAYPWIVEMFGILVGTTKSSTDTSTNVMGTEFKIEVAKNITGLSNCCNVSVTIKNIGTSIIGLTKIAAYVDYEKQTIYNQINLGNLASDNVVTFNISANEDPKGKKLKIVTNIGIEKTTTIT